MYKPFVVCQKKAGGTAIIAREEFQYYSDARRYNEFVQIIWFTSVKDEEIAVMRFPRLKRVLDTARWMGLGFS